MNRPSEKRCVKCGIVKPASSFYSNGEGTGYLRPQCKHCYIRRKIPEKTKARRRKWLLEYHLKNPEKIQARQTLNNRVRNGQITKPKRCEGCRKVRKLHAHHADYSKRLEVKWLCPDCHAEEHRKLAA
ncbi:MAG: hypothetical protein V4563_14910 [Pseudomonadota bacterium]